MRKIIKYQTKEEYLEPGQVSLRMGLGKTLSYVRDPKFRAIENTTLKNYPGLIAAWDVGKEGKNNESEGRDVLTDLTGNGHELNLRNFSWSEMSGYGGYAFDPKNLERLEKLGYMKFRTTKESPYSNTIKSGILHFKTRFRLSRGSDKSITFFKFYAFYIDDGSVVGNRAYIFTEEGEHVFEVTSPSDRLIRVVIYPYDGGFSEEEKENLNCIVEFFPEYPGALVFDGVDDHGICENMPEGLTDFTVIIKRTMFKLRVDNQNPFGWWNND